MSRPQTGATNYHVQLGILDKGCAIRGWVVFYVLGLVSMKGLGLRTLGVQVWSLVVWLAIELKYRKTT